MMRVAQPVLDGNEIEYVLQALYAGQLSAGPFVERFERSVADFVGVRFAVATSSGTTALHLALAALGITRGDEVILPSLTFVATANAVRYCGARPVFVDIDPATWVMDVAQAEAAITPRTKAILPVHLYGAPVNMGELMRLARHYRVHVVEDAAEALGSRWRGIACGAFGDMGIFSFYGNKLITTGEGGMVVTDNRALAERARLLRGQGRAPTASWAGIYWHEEIGYNYRMTELQGALGLAQMENIERRMAERNRLALWYRSHLPALHWQRTPPESETVFWMNVARMDDSEVARSRLGEAGFETRPAFTPLHTLPIYRTTQKLTHAENIGWRGLVLPTHGGVTEADVVAMAGALGYGVVA